MKQQAWNTSVEGHGRHDTPDMKTGSLHKNSNGRNVFSAPHKKERNCLPTGRRRAENGGKTQGCPLMPGVAWLNRQHSTAAITLIQTLATPLYIQILRKHALRL
jgi:hypothetical protein